MTAASNTLAVLALAAAALVAHPALARQDRESRARADVRVSAPSSAEGAKLSIRMRERTDGRAEFRMSLERAPEGLSPDAWIADAAGTLVLAGTMTVDRGNAHQYRLRIRTRDGSGLPLGAATLAELGGRAFEVRNVDEVLVSGTIPAMGTRTRSADAASGSGGGGGADDGANHDVGDDNGSAAADGAGHDANDDHGRGRGRR